MSGHMSSREGNMTRREEQSHLEDKENGRWQNKHWQWHKYELEEHKRYIFFNYKKNKMIQKLNNLNIGGAWHRILL